MDRIDCDRMFVGVLEAGSFSKAAERAGVSAGQASKLVSKLEKDLGIQLLKRTTRSLSATEVGYAYYERMKQLLEEIDALDASVRNASGEAAGRLRLSVPLSFGIRQLSPVLIDFAGIYPKIRIDVSFSDRIVNLVDEGYDAAVRIGSPGDSTLIARKLCELKTVTVASRRYLERFGIPRHPDELAKHECIIDTNARDPRSWRFRDPSTQQHLTTPVSGRMCFANAEVCLDAAASGFGITRIPNFFTESALHARNLQVILTEFEDDPYAAYVLYPPGRHLALKVRVLVDYLVLHFQNRTIENGNPRLSGPSILFP